MTAKTVLLELRDQPSIPFIDHPELRFPGRASQFVQDARKTLARTELLPNGGGRERWEEEQRLFKAIHAAGYLIRKSQKLPARNGQGKRAVSRKIEPLIDLHRRLVDSLVQRNLGLVYDMRERTSVPGVDGEEMFSEGLWTLMQAVTRFDPWRGYRFSTYACTSIRRGFLLLGRRQRRRKRLTSRFAEELSGRPDRAEEPADFPDTEETEIRKLRHALAQNAAHLTDLEQIVVVRRFLHTPDRRPQTLSALGRAFRLSKERIRQIQNSALKKLRAAMDDEATATTRESMTRHAPQADGAPHPLVERTLAGRSKSIAA